MEWQLIQAALLNSDLELAVLDARLCRVARRRHECRAPFAQIGRSQQQTFNLPRFGRKSGVEYPMRARTKLVKHI
jgi:hypothetical protein